MRLFLPRVATTTACFIGGVLTLVLLIRLRNQEKNVSLGLAFSQKDPDTQAYGTPLDNRDANDLHLSVHRLLQRLTQEHDYESLFYKVDIVSEIQSSIHGVRIYLESSR